MRKSFYLIILLFLFPFYSCDDGDIITVELEFGDTFLVCEGSSSLVFYKTKDDPGESLSLQVANLTVDEIIDVGDDGVFEQTITISATNPFNYRTYNNSSLPSDLFCNDVPNSEVIITQDIESTSGTAELTNVLTEDDDDTIPAELEKEGDTDGDGLPDIIDADDDGDNILTKDENPDPNGDGILNDAQDTDGDGTPDYLDDDDDGDGVKTRDEENESQDANPANDITSEESGADYLNPDVATTVPATKYREHTISQTYRVTLLIKDVDLEIIAADEIDFGTLEDSQTTATRKVTPDFP